MNVNVNMTVENVTWIRSGRNNNKCRCEYKNPKEQNTCQKIYILNPTKRSCENVEYLANTKDYSVITCEEIINSADSVSTNWSANINKLCQQILITKK